MLQQLAHRRRIRSRLVPLREDPYQGRRLLLRIIDTRLRAAIGLTQTRQLTAVMVEQRRLPVFEYHRHQRILEVKHRIMVVERQLQQRIAPGHLVRLLPGCGSCRIPAR